MTITTFCRADMLWLASLFQANETRRPYLNGVFIHSAKDGIHLVATDGKILGVFRDEAGYTSESCIVKIPKEAVLAIKNIKNKNQIFFGIIQSEVGHKVREARIFDASKGGVESYDEIKCGMENPVHPGVIWTGGVEMLGGNYPSYQKIIPRTLRLDNNPQTFNPVFLQIFSQVSITLGRRDAVNLFFGEESEPVLVDCGSRDFVGILMPMTSFATFEIERGTAFAPSWAFSVSENEENQ